jgi:DNA-binding IclR family transcriptional regulator
MPPLDALVARVRGEYSEMPGLQLTVSEASRLWQVDMPTCERLLEQLVREGFLYKTDNGAYVAVATSRC